VRDNPKDEDDGMKYGVSLYVEEKSSNRTGTVG